MIKKDFTVRLAAAAVVLLGGTACGNKAAATTDSAAPAAVEEPAPAAVEDTAAADENAVPAEYTTTESGLKYKVIKKGTGRSPKATDIVKVNYEGKLLDGTVFDSSFTRGEPISFPLNRVIPGWTEGLQLMQEGATYEFLIPYQLAYGEQGAGPIPPKSDLIFLVELIEVQ